ncbi:hypothetical protein FNV43_RR18207 [Rhamnella rubrinervis]|uniref:Uncharacterized protein n=1 Tax=Rhamnella rubrinervis TaxID=2594499 RepID=A0A8K0GVI6_9ROSA|nr:hypothetical protein FNV43_RR18207 [Rhamnella rubrinervis]
MQKSVLKWCGGGVVVAPPAHVARRWGHRWCVGGAHQLGHHHPTTATMFGATETIPLMGDLYANKFDELKSHIDTRFDHMANDFSSYRLDSMRELQSIDMKVERMAIDVQSIDMRVDRMATEFSEFRLDTMQAFRSMQDSMQEAFEFMRKQYHPGHHDTHMHDATEDVAMGDEGGALDLNMNMVDYDSEVQYVTP